MSEPPVKEPTSFRADAPVFVPGSPKHQPETSLDEAQLLGAPTLDGASLSLYEENWSAGVVPEGVRDLWGSNVSVLATTPTKASSSSVDMAAMPRTPTLSPTSRCTVPDVLKVAQTSSTATPDSWVMQTPGSPFAHVPGLPMVFMESQSFQLPVSNEPLADPAFLVVRASLLKYRASLRRMASNRPPEMLTGYKLIDDPEKAFNTRSVYGSASHLYGATSRANQLYLASGYNTSSYVSTPGAGNPGGSAVNDHAGKLLLKLAKGEVSKDEQVGAAQGAVLLQMLQKSADTSSNNADSGVQQMLQGDPGKSKATYNSSWQSKDAQWSSQTGKHWNDTSNRWNKQDGKQSNYQGSRYQRHQNYDR